MGAGAIRSPCRHCGRQGQAPRAIMQLPNHGTAWIQLPRRAGREAVASTCRPCPVHGAGDGSAPHGIPSRGASGRPLPCAASSLHPQHPVHGIPSASSPSIRAPQAGDQPMAPARPAETGPWRLRTGGHGCGLAMPAGHEVLRLVLHGLRILHRRKVLPAHLHGPASGHPWPVRPWERLEGPQTHRRHPPPAPMRPPRAGRLEALGSPPDHGAPARTHTPSPAPVPARARVCARAGGEEPDMPLAGPRMPADALDAMPPCVGTRPPSWPAGRLPALPSGMVHPALARVRVRAREQAVLAVRPTRPWRPLGGPWTHRRACPRVSIPSSPAEALRRASGGLQAGASVLPRDGTPHPCPAGSADVPSSEPEAQVPVPAGLLPDGSGELPPKLPPFFRAVPAGYPQAMGCLPVR